MSPQIVQPQNWVALGFQQLTLTTAGAPTTVTVKSVANPTQITTAAPHGLSTGATVVIAGGTGGTDINGTWTVTVVDASNFTIPVNVTDGTITIAPTVTPQTHALTVPQGATCALIVCTAQAARWRDDGVIPQTGIGMPLATFVELWYRGPLDKLRFVGQVDAAKLNVAYYR